MTRVIGPTGSRRRRRLLFGFVLVVAVAALSLAGSARAVHDYAVFQLDGNAQQSDTNPDGNTGDDWDSICPPSFGSGCSGPATVPSGNLTARTFDQDGAQNATIYTGGGSKDDLDIDGWQWKTDTGGLPDKDNLQQAFSARYAYSTTLTANIDALVTCIPVANVNFFPAVLPGHPYDVAIGNEIMRVIGKEAAGGCAAGELKVIRGDAGTTAASHSSGDVLLVALLYFGATRFDNSGDAQIGFWFLQGQVATQEGKKNTFGPDKHVVGDLLVLSDFTQGGSQPTVRAFKWVGSGGDFGTLQSISDPAAPAASCISGAGAVGDGDSFCAVVNPGDGVASPWSFLNKDGQNTYGHGELYEGGLNLSAFPGLAGECFGSFLSETRSSQSVSAVLKDFVLGPFAECKATITTSPSSTSLVLNGSGTQTVTDSAVVDGVGTLTPTGSVTFFFCTPAQLTPANTGTCTSGGTEVSTNALSQTTPGHASAGPSSASPAITAVGKYCWRGVYNPAAGSPYSQVTDAGENECLTVTDSTSLTSAQKWLPNDSATVAATGGTALTGELKIELHESNDCSGPAVTGQTYTKALSGATSAADRTLATSNTTKEYNADQTVSWKVTFVSSETPDRVSDPAVKCEVSSIDIINN